MQIELRFFASVREALETSQERVTVPPEVQTVGDLRAWLIARGAPWSEVLAKGRALRMAFNQQMIDEDKALKPGCEVAFFPPVTGG